MMRKIINVLAFIIFLLPLAAVSARADVMVVAMSVDTAPVIDGRMSDDAWPQAREVIVHDPIAAHNIALKAVHTEKNIYFLVRYPDPDESRLHKPWRWNSEAGQYEMGPEREDVFVFKWLMSPGAADLSIYSNEAWQADVWYWKANRTDPTGFADDKIQTLLNSPLQRTFPVISRSGEKMYLLRKGDKGQSAYRSVMHLEYIGDLIPQYGVIAPTGSRADIRAKGEWANGEWCIEFGRPLNTTHNDDIQFDINGRYLFGVSRFEIAGRKPDPAISQPLYGCGDVSAKMTLVFNRE
jgi:hypothetical protein